MWDFETMKDYVDEICGDKDQEDSKWSGLLKQMQQIVVQSLKSMCDVCEGRDKSFELYGYDFMVDSNIRPWLIEVGTQQGTGFVLQ